VLKSIQPALKGGQPGDQAGPLADEPLPVCPAVDQFLEGVTSIFFTGLGASGKSLADTRAVLLFVGKLRQRGERRGEAAFQLLVGEGSGVSFELKFFFLYLILFQCMSE
jgi:hypothetical protein